MPAIVMSGTTATSKVMGFNVSLLKGGTITQTIVGFIISSMVIVSVVATVVMITTSVGYNPPEPKPDSLQAYKNTVYTIYPLLNDVDPKGNNLTIVNITQPLHGTSKLLSGSKVQYNSPKYYSGNDTFEYTIYNGFSYAQSYIRVEVLNRAPEIVSISKDISKNSQNNLIDVFNYVTESGAQINDVDGDILTIVSITSPNVAGAVATIVDSQYIYYTPPAGYNSVDFFNYTITDGNATVSDIITINVLNDAPSCNPDDVTIPKNKVASLDLLANDYDINADNITIVPTKSGLGSKGVIVFSDDGLSAKYYPSADTKVYTDAFEYTITDGDKESASYVFVRVKNTPPTMESKTITIPKNSANNTISLDYSESDILDTVTITISKKPSRGTFTLSQLSTSNNVNYLDQQWMVVTKNSYTLVYTPENGVSYTDTISFKVDDEIDSTYATITLNIVNLPPVTVNDTITCQKNQQVTLNVVANDYDLNGDSLTLSTASSDFNSREGATVSRVDNVQIKYIAKSGFLGEDVASYVVSDADSTAPLTSTGYVIVTVVNTDPVAVDDTVTIPKGVLSSLDVLINDSDPNGDAIDFNSTTFTSSSGVVSSVNVTSPRNLLNYQAIDVVYQDKITYVIKDIDGATSSATVTINIVNTAPVANPDIISVKWNTSVVIPVLANDYDQNPADRSILTVKTITPISGSGGVATSFNGGKSILFTPTSGFVGTFVFTYTITDSDLESNAATVTVTVFNSAPVPVNDQATTHWRDTSVTVDVLSNDSDPEGDNLYILSVTQPSKGVVSIVTLDNGKDGIKYTISSAQQFVGEETITYTVTDYSLTATATLKVTVTNTAPVALGDYVKLHWSTSSITIPVLANDTDANNDPITIGPVTPPNGFAGTITKIDSNTKLQFVPTALSKGIQVVSYVASDGQTTSSGASLTIEVTNADSPSANTISKTVHWSTQTTGTTIPLFSTARDTDGDLNQIDIASSPTLSPSHGGVTLSNGDSNTLPNVLYKQTSNYLGADTFQVKVTDGADSAIYTVNMNVYNNKPTLTAVTTVGHWSKFASGYSVDAISLTSAQDADSQDTLSLSSISPMDYITVSGNQITFLPTGAFAGTKSYTIYITDGIETSSTTWTVTVQNSEPAATPTTTNIHWSKGFESIDVLSTITDGDSDSIDFSLVSSAATPKGTPSVLLSGSKKLVVWTLPSVSQSMLGSATFSVNYTDGWKTKVATYTVSVTNSAPVATDKTTSLHWSKYSTGVLIDVLSGATDSDSEDSISLSASPFSSPSHGTVSVSSGKALFFPTQGYVGPDSFTFTATDGLETSTKTVTLTINNQKPVANADSVTIHWNTSFVDINVLTNDVDADTEDTPIISTGTVTSPTQGTASIVDATLGTIRYTPSQSVTTGSKTFTYKVTDGAEVSTSAATVTVIITNNNAPSASPLTATMHWRSALIGSTFSLFNSITDTDGDTLTISFIANSGTYTVNSDGTSIFFQTASASKGVKTCTYKISDGLASSSATITTTVTNSIPTAQDISLKYHWSMIGTGLTIDAISKATDSDSADIANLQLSSVSQSQTYGNVVSMSQDKTKIIYQPTNLQVGNDTFTYTVTDGLDVSTTYTVTVEITSTQADPSDQVYSVHWRGTPVDFYVLQNVSSSGSDQPILDAIDTNPSHGTVQISQDSKYVTYTANNGYVGSDKFVLDYHVGLSNSEITVTVNVYNSQPTGTSKTVSTHWRTPTSINLLTGANDADSLDVPNLSAYLSSSPAKGVLSAVSSGSVTYTPETTTSAFIGTTTFNFKVFDGNMNSSNVPVSVTVTNTAPKSSSKTVNVLWSDFVSGKELSVLTLSPADSDDNSDPIRVKSFGSTSKGTVVAKGSGSDANIAIIKGVTGEKYIGAVSFTYVVTDDASNGDVTTTINVNVYNNKPVANSDSTVTHWNVNYIDIDVLANDSDPDSNTLTIASVYGSSATTAPIITGGKIRYYPKTATVGTVDVFKYELSDGAQSSEGTVSVNVTNTKPTTTSFTQTAVWSTIKNGLNFSVVQSSSDVNGDSLSLSSYTSITQTQGTLSTVGSGSSAQIKYVPTTGFTGAIKQVVFTISDGKETSTGTIDLTVTNNLPTANTTGTTYHWRQALQVNSIVLTSRFTDSDGDSVTISQVTAGGRAGVTLTATNTVKYQLASAWKGSDSFSVQFTDGWGSSTATFPVTVTNNVPVAYDIVVNVAHLSASSVSIPILSRSDGLKPTDSDSADSGLLSISSFTQPQIGTVTLSSGTFTFQNVQGNLANQTFTYTVSDGFETVTKTVTVNILDQAPTASDVSKSYHWKTIQSGVELNFINESSAVDPDGDSLTISSFTQPQTGTGSVARKSVSTSILIYTPPSGTAPLTATFKFTVSDGSITVEKTATISLTNTAPVAVADSITKLWNNKVFTITPLTNDIDGNGDTITISSVDSTSLIRGASLTIASPTSITYTFTGSGATGTDSFKYTITDGAATSTATVTITFTNQEPVVSSVTQSVKWSSTVTINSLLASCSDADGDTLSFVSISSGQYGSVVVNDASVGKVTYTPSSTITYTSKPNSGRWESVDSLTFKCTDGLAEKSGILSITIWNTPPVGSNKNGTFSRSFSSPVYTLSESVFKTGATDADSDTISLTAVQMYSSSDSSCSVALQSDKSVKFTYGQSFVGTQQFYFTLSDGQLTATYTYTITIANTLTCMDYTITTTKNSAATQFEDSIKSIWATNFGSETITLSMVSTTNLNSVGTISTVSSKLTYTPTARRSCTGTNCYGTYRVTNTASQTADCKVYVVQPNNAPTASNWDYEFSIRRDGNDARTFDYLTDSGATDTDTSDSLSISISSVGTCSSAGTLSIVSNKIYFVRNSGYADQRCTFTLAVADNDLSNPSTTSVTIGIEPISSPPIAVSDSFTAVYNNKIDILASDLLTNDYDPLGGTFVFAGVDCPDSTYCKNAGTPTILNPLDSANNRVIRVLPKIGSCDAEKVRYKISSVQDSTTAYADITIKYSNCVCSTVFDLIFILDGSGSISATNWKNMVYFVTNITNGFDVSSTGTNIGIVQYGTDSTLHLSVNQGTSKTTVNNMISSITQKKSSTATILGINTAVSNMASYGRSTVANKLFIHVTDGESNVPSNCYQMKSLLGASDAISPRFPSKTCLDCDWTNSTSKAQPCAEATVRSSEINSWAGYRQLTIGIGDGVTSSFGMSQIQKMNYDPLKFFVVDWSDLTSIYQSIIDEACNTVTTSSSYTKRPISDFDYTISFTSRAVTTRTAFDTTFDVTTFTYSLKVPSSSANGAITRFTLVNSINSTYYNAYNPTFPVYVGKDVVSSLSGFTWESLPSGKIVALGATNTFSLSVYGNVPSTSVSYVVTGSSSYAVSTISGPATSALYSFIPPTSESTTLRATYCSSTRCMIRAVFTGAMQYADVAKVCKLWNPKGIPVTIKTATEKTEVANISGGYTFFIGLNKDSGSWRWVDDNSVASYTDWKQGEPNNNSPTSYNDYYVWAQSTTASSAWWNDVPMVYTATTVVCQYKL